jgi:hypothetical protein
MSQCFNRLSAHRLSPFTGYSPAHCAMCLPKLAVLGITVRFPVITGRASVWSRRGLLSAGGCLVIRLNGYRSRRERECRCDQGPGKAEDMQSHFNAPVDSGLFRRHGRPGLHPISEGREVGHGVGPLPETCDRVFVQ